MKNISCQTHKTGSWYLFGVLFKISNEHPCTFYMKSPPPTRDTVFQTAVTQLHVCSKPQHFFRESIEAFQHYFGKSSGSSIQLNLNLNLYIYKFMYIYRCIYIYIYNLLNNFCGFSLDKTDHVVQNRTMVIRRYTPSDLISVI